MQKAPSIASNERGVTFRAILIALLIAPLNIYWIIQLEVVRYTHPTLIHPLSNVLFIVFWLVLLSVGLRRVVPKLALNQGELLTIYVMQAIISSLCSHDMMEILVTILGYPFRFASPENEWRDLFWNALPSWLVVSDMGALVPYYEGNSSLYVSGHLRAWAAPAMWWLAFIFVLFFVMICINTVLRKQWTERERLTYPIIQLPLEMTQTSGRFFRNRLMWVGFSIAAVISIINLLNSIYPSVPYIPVKRQSIDHFFTDRPWNAMGGTRVSFYPFAIGVSFLIPLDLLFSCWVFYWLYKMELVLGSVMGWRTMSRFPYANEQAFGSYIGLLLFALWVGRSHLKQVAQHILGLGVKLDDSTEPMRYRTALLGGLLGSVFLTVFSMQAGMSFWMVPLFFGIYYLLATMIARLRAELGFLVHDLHQIDPHSMIIVALGTRRLGTNNLTAFSLYMFFNRAYRAHPMPQQLEAFKFAERVRIHPKRMLWAILIAVVVGSVLTFWLLLDDYYRHGAESGYYGPWALGFARGIYGQLENWLNYPRQTDWPGVAFMGGGFSFTTALMMLRSRFLWWPLHPLGYAMANSWGMSNLWCCLLVTWIFKSVILRHGGLRSYRRAIPFFLGLALGDYVLGGIWSVLSILTDMPLYQFWP